MFLLKWVNNIVIEICCIWEYKGVVHVRNIVIVKCKKLIMKNVY